MPDDLVQRLRRFRTDAFPQYAARFKQLVDEGQRPTVLFIGCSDSRVVPHLLTGAGPGELFQVRNVAAFVPPHDGYIDVPGSTPATTERIWVGHHGTAAAIEFAVLSLDVEHIIVCGHSHCGGIRALYGGVPANAPSLASWLELGADARLPVADPGPEVLRRTERRSVVLQMERLMAYPVVRERVEAGKLALHGWHYVIEDGEVHVFDVDRGTFVPASESDHSGTGPYRAAK